MMGEDLEEERLHMCARADYREGFRVLAEELRRLTRRLGRRWRRRAPLLARDRAARAG